MFFNMKITAEQLLDIKCVLANVKKNQLAKELEVNSVDLSRTITNVKLLEKLNDYFDRIDPEINFVCNKLQEDNILSVTEPKAKYGSDSKKSSYLEKLVEIQDKHITHLEEDVWTLKVDIQKIARIHPDILKPDFGLSRLSQTGS